MKPAFDNFVEPQTDRRKFMLGLLFCSAAAVAAWREPRKKLDFLGNEKLDDLVPKKIGRWEFQTVSGLVVPPDDPFERSIYSQVLTRVYSDGQSPPIMLLLAQNGGQTGFLQIHRPEVCYTFGGYQISPITPHPIAVGPLTIPANRMDATAGGSTEHVIYWTRIGRKIPASWREQKLAVAEQNLNGIIPDAILVRFSTVDDDAQTAVATIDEFVREFLLAIPAARRPVFVV